MKVLDLQCSNSHRFEGWFASVDDFESQLARDLVACPVCGASSINRLPSAPRLNLSLTGALANNDSNDNRGNNSGGGHNSSAAQPSSPGTPPGLARVMRALRTALEKTENVGERFAEEARRIHYDEAPARGIRGTATADDAHALLDEGIDILPLPVPAALKGTLQ